MERIFSTGITIPEILLPIEEKVNMRKWAVIACDQFTANGQYWADVERFVGSSPSTLHMMLPEIYLNDSDRDDRIHFAKQTMEKYLNEGVLALLPRGLILVERTVGSVVRKGLMVAIDLQQYSVDPEDKPLIRPSEKTLMERIPPRIEMRRDAMVEMPHVLVLIDDKEDSVIGRVYNERGRLPVLYDFDLMKDGGHIKGYMVEDEALIDHVLEAVAELPTVDGMRFLVGDGNHSIATAKAVWDEAKLTVPEEQWEGHPLRYTLVELVNLEDPTVEFMPIHRVLYKVNSTKCLQYIVDKLNSKGTEARLIFSSRKNNLASFSDQFVIPFISRDSAGRIEITKPTRLSAAEEIQPIIEQFLSENTTADIDYIHDPDECTEIAKNYDNLGFIMPALKKEDFFEMVAKCGVMPKKTFSLGEAEQKRYYLECRLIAHAEIEEPAEEVPMEDETEEEIMVDEMAPEEILSEEE